MTDTPILALLRAGLPVEVSSRDAGGDYDQMCASATVHGGSGVPHNRRYGGTAQSRAALWRIVCVNNSANGAREVAALVVDLLDATIVDGNLLAVLAVSAPLEDRDDPSEYRWSITVEVSHYSPA